MSSRFPPPPHVAHDSEIYRRALSLALAGLAFVSALIFGVRIERTPEAGMLRRWSSVHFGTFRIASAEPERLSPQPLTDALRAKGYNECFTHDPVGLGPYAPYRNVAMGRLLVPLKDGKTDDGGYDVMIHFHGHEAVRKIIAQVSRGMAYVGIDKGIGSGAYEQAFACPGVFPALLKSIEKGLQAESGDPRAHIRHLALTAWSAGYGAVNEILKRYADQVDAVVLLDGLHGSWDATPNRDPDKPLKTTSIAPTIEFARRAVRGEKIFVFSHSYIDPVEYTPTSVTADLLLVEFGLTRQPVTRSSYQFGQDSRVDHKGFHVWGYRGKNELAHCAHIPLIAKALDIIEPTWGTPAMDRSVPFTPVKKWPTKVAEAPAAEADALPAAPPAE